MVHTLEGLCTHSEFIVHAHRVETIKSTYYVVGKVQIQNPFLTAQSTQIKSVISVPIKDFIHHYPMALFNDIPGSGRIFTTYPGRGAV